jgi:hypothetical protein
VTTSDVARTDTNELLCTDCTTQDNEDGKRCEKPKKEKSGSKENSTSEEKVEGEESKEQSANAETEE